MNKDMSSGELKENIVDFLKEHKEGSLATSLNNVPRSSPVQYFLGKDLDIYILSAGGEKFDAINTNPNVCLLVNTQYINYRKIKGVQIFGKAETSLNNQALIDEAHKFSEETGLVDYPKEKLNVIKIVPDEIVYLDSLKEGDRTKQILSDNQIIIKTDKVSEITH